LTTERIPTDRVSLRHPDRVTFAPEGGEILSRPAADVYFWQTSTRRGALAVIPFVDDVAQLIEGVGVGGGDAVGLGCLQDVDLRDVEVVGVRNLQRLRELPTPETSCCCR
jgi:hypothetical protein